MIRGAPFTEHKARLPADRDGVASVLGVQNVVGIPHQPWLGSRTETRWTGCGMYAFASR
jgi:hypothetical protein